MYATGGVAWGSVSRRVAFQDPFNEFPPLAVHETQTHTGWTAGTGVEYVLTPHLTFKGEYLFVDLGNTTVATPATGGWWPTTTPFRERQHMLRVGLNYKFW
jgi:outer membrane immunogenic protein